MNSLIVPFFISHKGCPNQCVFCNQVRISGTGEGLPSASDILSRIAAFRSSAGNIPAEVAFYGGTFTNLPMEEQEQLLLPLQPLIASGEVVSIRISTRPDAVDPGSAQFLAEMGVRTVELGAQSMDDGVLERAGRGHNAAQTTGALHALRQAGLAVGVQLMPGLPGDTAEKALASLDAVLALRPDFMRIYPTLVITGTRLESLCRAGEYAPLAMAEAVGLCKVMLHRALKAGVKVVRIGLQATAELESCGAVVAGPFHPAFRQLVESELCYDLLAKLSAGSCSASPVTVFCAPSRVSDITGQRRGNLERLAVEQGVKVAAVREDPALSPLEIVIEYEGGTRRGNMVSDLEYGGGCCER
jgi:histone acetyltransferase (RNA polymerase elongator complex component)